MPLAEQRDSKSTETAGSVSEQGGLMSRSALNLPNIITLSRIFLAVFLFWLIDTGVHWLAAFVVFVIAAGTDAIDGYVARRYGLITKIGRILDPFADKVIIGGAFMFLSVQPESRVTAWMSITVIGREMFVTSLRSVLEQEGKDFSAIWSGKIKMILQCAAIGASLLYLGHARGSAQQETLRLALDVVLWLAVAVTLYSGYEYVIRAIKMFRTG